MGGNLQDNIQHGLQNNPDPDIFAADIHKINKIAEEYNELKQKHEQIKQKETEFDKFINQFPVRADQFTIWGIITAAALIFDYIINSQTLSWLPSMVGQSHNFVYLWALIFFIIDSLVSISASGLLTKDKYEYEKQRKIWLFILWILCLIKIVLFVYFALSNPDKAISTNAFYLILMISFTILIYIILHYGGAGLYHLIRKISFWIKKEIFADYKSKAKEYKYRLEKLIHRINRIGGNPNIVFERYPIQKIDL